jgi:hypothetical protein
MVVRLDSHYFRKVLDGGCNVLSLDDTKDDGMMLARHAHEPLFKSCSLFPATLATMLRHTAYMMRSFYRPLLDVVHSHIVA